MNNQQFFTNLTIYVFVVILCVLIWLFMGGGAFWPIWVAFGFCISLFLEGTKTDWVNCVKEFLPFLESEDNKK